MAVQRAHERKSQLSAAAAAHTRQHGRDCEAAVNLWLRKHALSFAFHPLNGQNDINEYNMLIGVA
jgi:hypothetical protein